MNETSSIEGALLMLDGLTPHVVVPVQAIQNGKVMATVLSGCSTHAGKYCFDNLKPGLYRLRCQVPDGYVYYRAEGEAQWVALDGSEEAGDIIHVGSGVALSDINFRFASIKKGTWKTLTYMDGLVENYVTSIYRDPDGIMWFATLGGVSRYDGKEFSNLTERDGLASNTVYTIHRDPDGVMWFATFGGVSIYNGEGFINLTTSDGLADNRVRDIYQDPDGLMWFATFGGVSCYYGERLANLTTKDGLVDDRVYKIYQDSDGVMWFATFSGVSRYSGKEFRNFTEKDGLGNNRVYDIYQDPGGVMWFATFGGGVSRYDARDMGDSPHFANITREDGLVSDYVYSIHQDEDGVMWFATWGTGISRYDGRSFLNFAKEDGLVDNRVLAIYRDTAGVFWFGTERGISRYDTETFVSFTMKDGLPHDDVSSIHQTDDGVMWFGTSAGGVSLYNGKSFSNITTRDGLVDDRVMAIHCAPDGALWFATFGGGVSRYDGKSFLNFTVRDGLLDNNVVYSICSEPDGVMWFGTHEGVSRYDGNRFTNFTREDGLADNLHNSQRKARPMLALNCGAIPKELLTSELFGHCKGAFTGAYEDKIGLFEAASGGTILLDEVSEMPQDSQVHLLRVLEERKVQRLGEHVSRDVDVRVIAMTNRDLMKEVLEGRFREDLYYRLSVFPISVPPLRERPEDVPILSEHFLQAIDKKLDGFAPDVFQMLQSYSWPGNVRELRNAIHRAAALAEGKIQTYHFPPEITRGESLIQDIASERLGLSASVETLQRRLIEDALRECNGNHTYAARMLKMHRSNFVRLMKRLGVEYPDVPN